MPRRYKRTRRYKRKSYKKKSGGGMSIGDMAVAGFNMAKKIVRLINVEKKHYTTNSITQKNYAGTIIDLCDPVQGHDQDERNGDSIKPLHLTLRGYVYSDPTGYGVQLCRIIVFRYKDENGATLTVNDILDPALTSTTSAVFASKNWDKKFHSKILFDKVFTVGYYGGGATQDPSVPSVRTFKISKKLFGHINWSDSTSTEEGGGLYMLVISQSTLDADAPTVQWVSRVTYTDN